RETLDVHVAGRVDLGGRAIGIKKGDVDSGLGQKADGGVGGAGAGGVLEGEAGVVAGAESDAVDGMDCVGVGVQSSERGVAGAGVVVVACRRHVEGTQGESLLQLFHLERTSLLVAHVCCSLAGLARGDLASPPGKPWWS